MKKIAIVVIIFLITPFFIISAIGQPPPPPPVPIPLDGGLISLLVAGIIYGSRKFYLKSKNKQTDK